MSKNEMQDNEKVTEFDFTDLGWKYDELRGLLIQLCSLFLR